jgi:nucleoid DNA-binding protein
MATKKKAKVKKMTKKVAKKKTLKNAASANVKKGAPAINKALNKANMMRYLSDVTGVMKKEVVLIMDAISDMIEEHLKKRGPGEFVLPGLAKFKVVHKPATKARQGINPFTGQPTTFAARPARSIVKIRALKKLKDMVR